jgi:hypothetical protein
MSAVCYSTLCVLFLYDVKVGFCLTSL